jgi:hypothetical protein
MADPAEVETQNILPIQALFNVDNSFNTFIGQGQPFVVSATESIGIQDVPTLNATLYPTFSPVSTGQVTSLDVASTKFTFNPFTGVLSVPSVSGNLSGTASSANNLVGGAAGNLVYQTTLNATGYISNGTSGQVLTSNGAAAPTWTTPTFFATVTDDTTTNATRYPLFADQTSGSLTTEYTSSTKYQYNPSTGTLTATQFSGSGVGLTSIPNGALTNSSLTIGSTSISLGSTATTLAGLTSVTSTTFVGALSGNATTATSAGSSTNATNVAITDDTSTSSAVYPTFVTNTTGNLPVKTSSTKLSFVPSTGTLTLAAVQATNSAGLALKNSAGTTQMSMGAGGGDNLSINVSTNLNGANAQIDISPTGTGHVHIKPTGVNSVEIAPVSVGDMDNMIIGATTPAAGTFTTLTATTSVTSPIVGAASGSTTTGLDLSVNSKPQARLVEVGDGTRPLIINGGSAGGAQITGITANAVLGISAGGANPVNFYTNGRVNTLQFQISNTTGAVNYIQATGSVTSSPAAITVQGSDSNIRMNISSKGTESVDILTNNTGTRAAKFTYTASSVNWVQMTGAVAGSAPVLSVQGSDTNIPLVLQPKGTGALQAQQTDSTATGGNARGAYSVDWQMSRASAANVASSQSSTIGGGQANQSSGFISVVAGGNANLATGTYGAISGGTNNAASGSYSWVGGGGSNTASGQFNVIGGGFTNSGTANAAVTTQSATMNGTTAVTLSGSNANIKVGQIITGTSIAGDTYVAAISGTSLTLSKVASGSSTSTLSFYTPHGVVVGGGNNQATGSYSFIGGGGDAGTAANRNVASGDWSFVGGGRGNSAVGVRDFIGGGGGNATSGASTGDAVIVGGNGNTSTGYASSILGGVLNQSSGAYAAVLGGVRGTTRGIVGYTVFPASISPVGSSAGNSQAAMLIIGKQTTDATSAVLTCDGSAAATFNQVILPNNSAYFFKGEVIAGVTGGGNTKGWTIEGVIKRGANAASTAIVGTATVTSSYADAGAATWAITATADTTNGGLAITFTGQAATTIRVVCKLETTEMTY